MKVIRSVADKVIVLKNGVIVESNTAEEIFKIQNLTIQVIY